MQIPTYFEIIPTNHRQLKDFKNPPTFSMIRKIHIFDE